MPNEGKMTSWEKTSKKKPLLQLFCKSKVVFLWIEVFRFLNLLIFKKNLYLYKKTPAKSYIIDL